MDAEQLSSLLPPSLHPLTHLLAFISSSTPSLVPVIPFCFHIQYPPPLLLISPFSPSFYPFLLPLLPPFPLTSLPSSPLPSPPLPPFIKCGCWLAGSSWLASGGGYSFIIPSRLPARLATMSQELNICHYYLLVLFDFEAAQ